VRANVIVYSDYVNDRFLAPIEHEIICHHIPIFLLIKSHMSDAGD